jgi:1-acyl-sn-glycerol-3-phosphate acyltransferase
VLLRFAVLRVRNGGNVSTRHRALWLHRACRMIVRRLSMRVSVSGPLPDSGLVVSNHLSYLDILFFSSVMPCVFVSKSEVISWPLFGVLARCGGTIFVERGRGVVIESVSRQIAAALEAGIPVVLFPEGTSTDGQSVLTFFPSLFEAAVRNNSSVFPAAISYETAGGCEADLCYYGDDTFAPHLLSVLAHRNLHARIAFPDRGKIYSDRKSAARESREQVVVYRQTLSSRAAEADRTFIPA